MPYFPTRNVLHDKKKVFSCRFLSGRIYKKHSTGNEEWIESETATITIDYVLQNSGGSRPSYKGGPGHPDPEIRGGGAVSKKFFSALRASVWSKNKGGQAPALDPSLLNHLIKD